MSSGENMEGIEPRRIDWQSTQDAVKHWGFRNFGIVPKGYYMLGLMEEVAEYLACCPEGVLNLPDVASEAYLVRREMALDSFGDQTIYVLNLCAHSTIHFGTEVADHPLNLPNNYTDRELMGALGLASRALLKNFQGIRGYTHKKTAEDLRASLGIWWRWAQWQHRFWTDRPIELTVRDVWEKVSMRDWTQNKTDGRVP